MYILLKGSSAKTNLKGTNGDTGNRTKICVCSSITSGKYALHINALPFIMMKIN